MTFHGSSYRDRSGRVILIGESVFRVCYDKGKFLPLLSSQHIKKLMKNGCLIETAIAKELPLELQRLNAQTNVCIFQHKKIDLITYPYEWTFSMLKKAAIFHLDFHIGLLKNNFDLRDATTYNIQFVDSNPIFIDFLSIEPYKEGSPWMGHRQFLEQFVFPLLWQEITGIKFNDVYRGYINGIPTRIIREILPLRKYASLSVLLNIVFSARMEKKVYQILRLLKEKRFLELQKIRKLIC